MVNIKRNVVEISSALFLGVIAVSIFLFSAVKSYEYIYGGPLLIHYPSVFFGIISGALCRLVISFVFNRKYD